jgi:hydrogenase expression/formation protein HypC
VCLSVPGKVIEVGEADGIRIGRVDFGGVSREVCLEHVDAVVGDWVLVHVGFALSKISSTDAAELLEMLKVVTGNDWADELEGSA